MIGFLPILLPLLILATALLLWHFFGDALRDRAITWMSAYAVAGYFLLSGVITAGHPGAELGWAVAFIILGTYERRLQRLRLMNRGTSSGAARPAAEA